MFAGDCGDCPELRQLARDADTLVIACVCFGTADQYNNIITGTDDVGAIAKAAGVRRVVLTHAPPGMDTEDSRERAVRAVAAVSDAKVVFPDEMTTVELPSSQDG